MLIKSLISCQTSCKENLIQEKVAFVRHSIPGKEIHVLYLDGRHMGGGTQGRISMLFFQYFVCRLVTIMVTRQCQDSSYFGRLTALPPICLPSVYLTLSHVWLYLPGLPSPLLHNASDPKLELGKAWEQGYVITMYATLLLTLILFPDWGCCWRFRNLIITSSNSLLCCYIPSFLLFLSIPQFPLFSSPPLPFAYSFPLSSLFIFLPLFPPLPFYHFLLIIVISCWKPSFLVLAHTLIHTEQFKQKMLICHEPSTSTQSSWSVMNALFQCCWYVEIFCTQYFVEFAVSAWLVCTLLTFQFFIWTVVLKDSSSMYLYQWELGEVLICYKRDGTCQLDCVLTTTKGYSWSARLCANSH